MEGIKVEAVLSMKDVRKIAKIAVEMIDEKKTQIRILQKEVRDLEATLFGMLTKKQK